MTVSFKPPKGKVYLRFWLVSEDLIEGLGAVVDNVVVPFLTAERGTLL